jgi:hypothetical protein
MKTFEIFLIYGYRYIGKMVKARAGIFDKLGPAKIFDKLKLYLHKNRPAPEH